ncbi:MAG: hypothetical protein ACYTBR_09825 [Planctomycetota bacterium]|jgi:hypothetical protein
MYKRTIVGLLVAVLLAAIVVVQATRVAEAAVVAPASTGHAFEGGIGPFSEAVRALATLTIAVDFGNTSTITESCGTVVTATAATNLTAAQKTSIRDKIKAKYEAVLGAGNATVTEEAIAGGTGTGDYGVIISGGKGPGGEYGDAGAGSGKPAIVHVGFYKNKGFTGDGLINAIAETAAHEVAHRIGVSHNGDKSKRMASGTKVSKAQREADARPFSDDDKDKIKENLKKNTESKSSDSDKDLNSQCGHFPDMGGGDDFVPDDHIMGAVMWYEGWPGLEFGYVNVLDEFIFQGTAMLPGDPEVDDLVDTMPFLHTGQEQARWVLALSDGVDVFPFDVFGLGEPVLAAPNPDNPETFLLAELQFDLDGDLLVDNTIFLDAIITGPHSGGFLIPPQPCPCDCEDPPDGTVDVGDFLALLAQWGGPGPCDCEDPPDGAVDVGDFLALLATWGPCPVELVPAGIDCWETSCGRTKASFCEQPLPADFFEPGSEPFEGTVALQGATGEADTQVARLQDMVFDRVPQSDTIDIEIVALNLVSCAPITVMVFGEPQAWDVAVSLSETQPPPGQMTVTKTHENGGVFTSDFLVQPVFTFTKVDPPHDVRVLDTGLAGYSPDHLFSVGEMPWVHELEPGMPIEPCGVNFVPGVEQLVPGGPQCCRPVWHSGITVDHIVVADLACPMCLAGACCMPDGSCVMALDEADCVVNFSGEYKGDGTICAADSDDDGIVDVRESNDCCGPSDPCNTGTSPVNPDTDGDGCPDGLDPAPCDEGIGC